jgi:flap endonuclease-1
MGVNISKIIPKKEINLSDLKGKTIAIDAYVTLYQFLTTIRQPDGTPLKDSSGNITSHLSGLFYRNINLLQEGIKPVYVFDGKPPELKLQEIKKRQEAKDVAEQKYKEAKDKKDIAGMNKFSKRTVKITSEMLEQSKELLTALGIPVVQAHSEGEAEAATMARQGKVYAAASQDYDTLLYATPYLVRNLTSARRKKLPSGLYIDVKPELIEFQQVLNELNIEKDQLICLAILVGTDYNPGGVKGLGQHRALQLVQKYKYPVEIFKRVQAKYDFIFDWQEIFSQFSSYESNNFEELEFNKPNEEKIKELLLKHDFSEMRIYSGLQKLKKLEESKKQKGLSDFF